MIDIVIRTDVTFIKRKPINRRYIIRRQQLTTIIPKLLSIGSNPMDYISRFHLFGFSIDIVTRFLDDNIMEIILFGNPDSFPSHISMHKNKEKKSFFKNSFSFISNQENSFA